VGVVGGASATPEGGMSASHRSVVTGAAARSLLLDDLDYELPAELIAQQPVEPRDSSRLLVCRRGDGVIEERSFSDLPALMRVGDVLVRNDTRVFPARSFFRRASGGRLEVLFLRRIAAPRDAETWEALVRGRPRVGEVLACDDQTVDWHLRCEEKLGGGSWVVTSLSASAVLEQLVEVGVTPLPPYIHERLDDAERYQTVYARRVGSAAAPTAGLHFTPELDDALRAAGVAIETLTLHVGLGTFQPLQATTLADNRLHSEEYMVDADVWARVRDARLDGRRVVAVGTTTVRTLEHLARAASPPAPGGRASAHDTGELRGETDLFITPGFDFRCVDALVTNFHLPRTSLLALVMAFCGVDETRHIYQHAVAARYRFYSLGDAMLVV
jgi:S-adenosylmethionine:tRNA ribosyltransferase-isomerase